MSLEGTKRQKSREMELPLATRGETPTSRRSGEAPTAVTGDARSGTGHLMEEVVERANARAALKRVRQNKGSPGIDGMTVQELSQYLAKHWETIREQLLSGTYQPKPVKRQQIPKQGGGTRELGIPCAVDRFVQQAILQVLQPRLDPTFSSHSFGFRPGRSAHQAVRAAQTYIQAGRRWVVDIDLEKFFDRVNHDVLMGRLAKRIADRRLLGLIRRYLEAGVMVNGVAVERHEGTPQGGPLSPLLTNVLLDEVDKELEKRGHAFCRYADDLNVYARSKRAADDVMQVLRCLLANLRLRVNDSKSAVAHPWDRTFLGFTFWVGRGDWVRLRIAKKALAAMKDRVRQLTSRARGRTLQAIAKELSAYLRGWKQYFRLDELPKTFVDLDGWIRRRLRAVQLNQWRTRGRIFRQLRARGVPERPAGAAALHGQRWWRIAQHGALHAAMPTRYFDEIGLLRLAH